MRNFPVSLGTIRAWSYGEIIVRKNPKKLKASQIIKKEKKGIKVKMDHKEPAWKYPLIIAIIVVPALIWLTNWVYTTDRAQKIKGHLDLAKEVRIALCDDKGMDHKTELETEWQKYYNKLGVQYTGFVSTLRFEEVDAYYDAQCELAKEYLQLAKDARTDQEKLASYKRVRQLRDAVVDSAIALMDVQLVSAQACADTYLLAEQAEIQVVRIDPYADQARGYIASGAWDFCAFYSQQSVVVSEQVSACQNNITIAIGMEQTLGTTHPLAEQARQYQSQENWSFCAFYAAQAVYDMQTMLPTPTTPP